ncbi:MAG: hypothetical protein AAF663_06035 [Planctomycetota bacterium]
MLLSADSFRPTALRLATAAALLAAGSASAINIRLDYTYDTQGFFGSGNPQGSAAGAQAKAALEDAANFFSEMLEDSFVAVQTPDPYIADADGQAAPIESTWTWSKNFTHPGTGSTVTIVDPTIPADEYVIYAGGRSLGGNTLGRGGSGGFNSNSSTSWYFASERAEIEAIGAEFSAALQSRGQGDGDFGAWGGSITFDNDSSTDWNFDWTNPAVSGFSDFYSVAIHELGHALGFGGSDWEELVLNGTFFGSESFAENGNVYPQTSSDNSHWQEDTMSTVRGTGVVQEAAMDPTLTNGTRKLWTDLDSAGLADIGYEIAAATVVGLTGDYDDDNQVAQGDLNFVLNNWGNTRGPWANADGFATPLVDQEELNRVLNNWGATGSPSFAGFDVPEPAAFGLFAAAIAVGGRRQHMR